MQIIRQHNERINILSKLRQEWHTTPKDMNKIKELEEQLDKLTKAKRLKKDKWKGQFG